MQTILKKKTQETRQPSYVYVSATELYFLKEKNQKTKTHAFD